MLMKERKKERNNTVLSAEGVQPHIQPSGYILYPVPFHWFNGTASAIRKRDLAHVNRVSLESFWGESEQSIYI